MRYHIAEKIKFLKKEEEINNENKLYAQQWLDLLQLVNEDQTHYTSAELLIKEEYERDKDHMRNAFADNLSEMINKWFDRDYKFKFRKIEKRGKNTFVLVDEKINKSTKRKRTGKLGLACGGGVGQSIAFISGLILARSLGSEILILDESFSNVGKAAMESLVQVFPYLNDIQIITTEHYTDLLRHVDHREITLGIKNNTTVVVNVEDVEGEELDTIDEGIKDILATDEMIIEDTGGTVGTIKDILVTTGQVGIEDKDELEFIDDEFSYTVQ